MDRLCGEDRSAGASQLRRRREQRDRGTRLVRQSDGTHFGADRGANRGAGTVAFGLARVLADPKHSRLQPHRE